MRQRHTEPSLAPANAILQSPDSRTAVIGDDPSGTRTWLPWRNLTTTHEPSRQPISAMANRSDKSAAQHARALALTSRTTPFRRSAIRGEPTSGAHTKVLPVSPAARHTIGLSRRRYDSSCSLPCLYAYALPFSHPMKIESLSSAQARDETPLGGLNSRSKDCPCHTPTFSMSGFQATTLPFSRDIATFTSSRCARAYPARARREGAPFRAL